MDIYHIVLVTKYRRPVLTGPVKDLVYRVIQDIFDEKKLVILEMNGEADHIHILFEADPFTAPGTLVNIIKTKTSRYARKEYGETFLKEYYWKPLFWSDSYFVTTVSENSLQMVQEYINEHYKEEIRLNNLADMVGMTAVSFSRFFKLRTGKSLSDYIIDIRLGFAARLLVDSTMSVAEICYDCGFNNLSNFNRIFKKKKACSPKEFRENYRKKKKIV